MDLTRLTLTDVRNKIASGFFSATEVVKATLKRIEETKSLNTFVTVDEEGALAAAKMTDERLSRGDELPLGGVPVIVKDNICTAGMRTTCASKALGNYVPPYDATVVKRLKKAGAIIVGKANMDEFAMGSTSENSAFGVVKNAVDPSRSAGGSSGGAASGVAAYQAYAALGTDTGGSVRQPASYCGVVGLKPTYSAVSRYGLIAFASSCDQIGPIARTVRDCAEITNVIAGYDEMDATSARLEQNYLNYEIGVIGKTIGIPKEFFTGDYSEHIKRTVLDGAKLLEKMGAKIREISIKTFDAALSTYLIITCAEAATNLARYDGIKYGVRAEGSDYSAILRASRSAGLGEEVKRRIMLGNFVLSSAYYDEYYLKAAKLRTLIKRDFDVAFDECDFLLTPSSPTTATKLGSQPTSERYASDIFTAPVNLVGCPAISVPCGVDDNGLPIGMQLIGKSFDEKTLFGAAEAFERERR